MDTEDIKYLDSLVKISEKHSLKKQRVFRNLFGLLILLPLPIITLWGVQRVLEKSNLTSTEFLFSEMFGLGFITCLLLVFPLLILSFHLKGYGDYDDLKKNDMLVELYKKNKENL